MVRKKYIVMFFLYSLVGFALYAGSDEELFLHGNKYYEQKEYDNALCSYEKINKKGPAVLYNMGNCAFQCGNYAEALLYWSRAETGSTAQEYRKIARNKELAYKKLGISHESWYHTIAHILHAALPYVSLLLLQIFFLMCWYFFIFLIGIPVAMKKIILGGLCIIMGCTSTLLTVYYTRQQTPHAIVMKKNVQLFAGPDKGFHMLTSLAYANDVSIKESREGWYKIRYADMIGWVEADDIQII